MAANAEVYFEVLAAEVTNAGGEITVTMDSAVTAAVFMPSDPVTGEAAHVLYAVNGTDVTLTFVSASDHRVQLPNLVVSGTLIGLAQAA